MSINTVFSLHIEYCINEALHSGDTAGVLLGKLLLRMSKTQRNKLYSIH
jgi:hypothetical protein